MLLFTKYIRRRANSSLVCNILFGGHIPMKKLFIPKYIYKYTRFNEYCKKKNVVPKEMMSTLRRIFEEYTDEQIDFIDQIHYSADKKGNIHSNKTLISQLFRFDPSYFSKMDKSVTSGMVTQSEFWKLKEHELFNKSQFFLGGGIT